MTHALRNRTMDNSLDWKSFRRQKEDATPPLIHPPCRASSTGLPAASRKCFATPCSCSPCGPMPLVQIHLGCIHIRRPKTLTGGGSAHRRASSSRRHPERSWPGHRHGLRLYDGSEWRAVMKHRMTCSSWVVCMSRGASSILYSR